MSRCPVCGWRDAGDLHIELHLRSQEEAVPARSKVQQQAAGTELARRRRTGHRTRFKDMTNEDLRHLASTKHTGLPKRKHPKKPR